MSMKADSLTGGSKGTRCAHCSAASVSRLFRYESQETLRCNECQGYFNRPSGNDGDEYDAEYYRRNYLPREPAQLNESRRLIDKISPIVSAGSVLDYGCGTGIFLQAAAEAGYANNVGADISPHALEIGSHRNLQETRWINLGFEKLPNHKFDIITLMDSISHVPDARATLQMLRDEYLAEGGVLAVRTPHIPPVYFSRIVALSSLIGKRNASSLLFARSRYALFDGASLQRFLESLDFNIAYEERSGEYKNPLPWSSGKRLLKEIVGRVLSTPIQSMFVIARRRSGKRH